MVEQAPQSTLRANKIRVGDAVLDVMKNQLMISGETNPLEPRLVRVLLLLCEHAGEVVTRDALLPAVSSLEFAGDESLTQAMSKLRAALGDNPKAPTYIKTIPRRGYLLLAPVEEIHDTPMMIANNIEVGYGKKIVAFIILLAAALIAILAFWPSDPGDIEFIEKKDTEFIEQGQATHESDTISPAAGTTKTVGPLKMRYVPAGEFMMDSSHNFLWGDDKASAQPKPAIF